jgi:predicted nucleic acid-binding Zn ribbon protein
MPTYVYKFVDSGETIEVQQGFHDDTLTEFAHPVSGDVLPVKKVFTPVGVTFKGSGFFKTDNRGKKSAASTGGDSTGSGSTADSTPSTSSDSSTTSSESAKPKAPTSAPTPSPASTST